MSEQIAKYNINMTDLAIIMSLDAKPGASLNTMAKVKKINKAVLSKSLKKLQKADLIDLQADEHHKQKYNIYLTDESKKMVPKLRKSLTSYEEKALIALNEKEREQLKELLAKVYKQEV